MPAFNPKDYGWDKLFQHQNDVKLPEQLTKKWWDKKKTNLAKMTRATGIGEALESLADTFKKVVWEEFNPHATLVNERVEDMKQFIKSAPIKNLHEAFKDLKVLAADEAKELKKNVLSKGSVKYAEEIADCAEWLFVATNTASLVESLRTAMVAWQKGQSDRDIRTAQSTFDGSKLTVNRIVAAARSIRADENKLTNEHTAERLQLVTPYNTLCRDMTQPLGNLMKCQKSGVAFSGLDLQAFKNLFEEILPIANAQSSAFLGEPTKANMLTALDNADRWAADFVRIVGPVQIVSIPRL